MKIIATCTVVLISCFSLIGQGVEFVAEAQMELAASLEVNLPLADYETVDISLPAVRAQLSKAPQEFKVKLRESSTRINLPLPNGQMREFSVVESSVMQEGLQARWPQLRTYRLIDVADPRFAGRLAVTPQGLTALYTSPYGDVYLEPYASGQARYHVVYYNKDIVLLPGNLQQLACGYDATEQVEGHISEDKPLGTTYENLDKSSVPANIREYIMALTCTGEYAQQKGGTVEAVLSSFVSAMNIANVTFENEVGVRVRLIDNQEQVIYLNPGTDPFINADQGGELLSQVQGALVGAGVPTTAYDMGHVFTSGCTDVGGVVGGQVCTIGKDRGVTCHYSNNLAAIINGVFTHEVAHQFAVAHSWSNCPSSLGQLATGSAYEPGSGSTIMSYAGACGNQNIQFNNDNYYHGHSVEQFINFTRVGQASNCATVLSSDNTEPQLTLDYPEGLYIPISTPFELNADATDADDDDLTYCWEQLDLGPIAELGAPIGSAPIFRSYPPNSATNRVLPRLPMLVTNQTELTETLPSYSRPITFRCTVRDNNPEIGATIWEDIAFRSTVTAGPFVVMSPNAGNESWKVGEYREVTWDVANTDNEFVNCQSVNIRLSADGGYTYPYTLLTETPNSGSAFVTVPEVVGNDMRIRVEAANNIFFDISNNDFTIEEATEAVFTLGYGPISQQVCLPNTATVDFNSASVLGFENSINLSIYSELPTGVTAAFSNNDFAPGEDVNLVLDLAALEDYHGPLEIVVAASASGQDTTYRTIYLDVVDNDFSDLALLTPLSGQAGINLGTDFSWTPISNALLYDWELSDDAGFSNILDSGYGLSETAFTPNIQFEANTLFYWRVRAINACGPGEWALPRVFHTINSVCSPQQAEDTPLTIPGTGPLPTITSEVFVPFAGQISDVNIPYLSVRYQPIQNFYIALVSPSGTEVRLYDQSCFSTDQVTIGFDDQAPNDIICPPDDGILFRPAEPLSAFIGESSEGIWTLKVRVLETGFGAPGQITSWGIEFCAEGNAAAPALVTNDTLFVPPLESNPISSDLLNVTDNEEGPFQLTYSLVSTPGHGKLYIIDQELSPGSTFTQGTINAMNLRYENTNPDAVHDAFTFVVEDGTGGFLPVQRFNIKIDEGAVVGTDDLLPAQSFLLFPNPTSGLVTMRLAEPTKDRLPLRVLNINGQLLFEDQLPTGSLNYELHTEQLPSGIYLVQLGGSTTRLVKQ